MKILLVMFTMLFTTSLLADTGFVRKLMGEVTVDGKKVSVNDKVMQGQTIEAKGPRSMVIVKFESGSQIALKDGSLKVEETKNEGDSLIILTKGIFASHFLKKGKGTQTVKSKHAVMGIRGTKFYVEEKDDLSYLCVCDGSVEISDGKKSELIGKNEDATAAPNKTLQKTKANSMMINMANAFVKEME